MPSRRAYRFIGVEVADLVTVITINRPEVFNALHLDADRELDLAFAAYEADDTQRVAIITGTGERAFSAGNDLKEQARLGTRQLLPSGFGALTSRTTLEKPIIAAVNGLALGGGFEMALSCDLIISDERAEFALPEPRFGLAAAAGGVQRLAMSIGVQRAMGMALTGRRVCAQEAFSLGFVTALAAPGRALAVARDWACMIAECSPAAIVATRLLARQAETEALAGAAARTVQPALARLRKSPDYLEGARAFAEHRKPVWSTKDREARSP